MFVDNKRFLTCLTERLKDKGYKNVIHWSDTLTVPQKNEIGYPDLFSSEYRRNALGTPSNKGITVGVRACMEFGANKSNNTMVLIVNNHSIEEIRGIKRYFYEQLGWKYKNFDIVTIVIGSNLSELAYAYERNTIVVFNGKVSAKRMSFRKRYRKVLNDVLECYHYAKMSQKVTDYDGNGFRYYGGYSVSTIYFLMIAMFVFYTRSPFFKWLSPVSVNSVFYQKNLFTLITAMFVHADLLHLIGNIIALYIIGKAFESNVGSVRTFVTFMLSGIFGNLISTAYKFDTMNAISLVGASGAIFGLLGGLVVIKSYDFNSRRFLLKEFLASMGLSVVYIFYCGTSSANVDNACHIGGFISGIVVTLIYECVLRLLSENAFSFAFTTIEAQKKYYAMRTTSPFVKGKILREDELKDNDISRCDGFKRIRF